MFCIPQPGDSISGINSVRTKIWPLALLWLLAIWSSSDWPSAADSIVPLKIKRPDPTQLVIFSSGATAPIYKQFSLPPSQGGQDRLVIDFPHSSWLDLDGELAAPLCIEGFKCRLGRDEHRARLVLEGSRKLLEQIDLTTLGKEVLLKSKFKPTPADEVQAVSNKQANPPIELTTEDEGDVITVSSPNAKKLRYFFFYVDAPSRLVIDLLDLDPKYQKVYSLETKGAKFIKVFRTGLPDEPAHSLRLVFELTDDDLNFLDYPSSDGMSLKLKIARASKKDGQVLASGDSSHKNSSSKKIVIDVGHGGYDAGASYGGVDEKDLTLAISEELARSLKAAGYEVVMTRTEDVFLSLEERVAMIKQLSPKAVISVHCNALDSLPDVAGLETYFYTIQSEALAKSIHRSLVKASQTKDRNVRQARFYVIRETEIPSVLVEFGYLSNPSERKRLSNPKHREQLAKGVTSGLNEYFKQLNRSNSLAATSIKSSN